MSPKKIQVLAVSLIAALVVLAGCTSTQESAAAASKRNAPVRVGQTQYRNQIIPVFDGLTARCEKSTAPQYPIALRDEGVEGVGTVMIIVDERGAAVEFGIVSSSPDPQFGLATLAAAKQWRFFPMKDGEGKPFLHALRMEITYRISRT